MSSDNVKKTAKVLYLGKSYATCQINIENIENKLKIYLKKLFPLTNLAQKVLFTAILAHVLQ